MASFYRTLAFGLSYIAVLTLTGCPDDITKKDQNQGNLPTDFESVDASDSAGTEKDAAVNPDVVPETCETNAQCAALVKDSDACLVALCDVTTQKCFVGEKKDLSECDDANACTLFTVCMDGECISPNNQVLACNDANPCTADTCDADSGCVHTPNEGACDDGNPCTVGDTCSLGVCTGEPGGCGCEADLDCAQFDDGNLCNGTMVCENGFCKLAEGSQVVCPASDDPCVTSQCVATTGECVTAPAPEGTACSDGISCTLGDGCTQGKCVAGTDQCPQCVSSAECAEFDDGNACNGAVLCINGKCASLGPVSCPQVGPCLSSKCDPATGQCAQSPAPQGTSCDDFNACTVADTCSNGVCQGGKLKNCDDKNPCTFDECSPKTGTCQHMTAPDCGGMCGDGTCGPQDSCTTCPEDCGFCPDECGDGECTPNEDCLVCPVDCGNCGAECGDGFCGPDENCKSCQKDCGPCGVGNGCEATEGPGCGGCVCEGCVCKLDPYCCDIQWDDLCVSECTNECNGCGVDPGGCGDGQCAPGENCQSCSKDCGPCGSGDGCQANEGPGCGGCACEACVCGMDAFCCDVQWDDLCASECAEECNGCGIVPTGCGNGKCEANENCQTCPKDCGTCPGACGNGKCEANENCQTCPKDCGTCPGACGNGKCEANENCQTCPKDCGTCPGACGNGKCEANENCQTCPKDCGTCPGACGDGICIPGEDCKNCTIDCGPCGTNNGCQPTNAPGCGGCACEACVCKLDAYCCDVQWDSLCSAECANDCNGCPIVPGGCGDQKCGPNETCESCPKDCGTCPSKCGDMVCSANENCQTCPLDCGPCQGKCGDMVCSANENCQTCPLDCGPCQGKCGDMVCSTNENCQTCPLDCGPCQGKCGDMVCSDNESCQTCPLDCGPCQGKCGDGQCAPGEDCKVCPTDCGPCGTTDGCKTGAGPGCGGCACEKCVCAMDPFCCQTLWDALCVSECTNQCQGCPILPGSCGDGQCGPNETCLSCPKDCGSCPPKCGDGQCVPGEDCKGCPLDCGPCVTGDGCQPANGPGCNGCVCEQCVCAMDAFCCQTMWDNLCASECANQCNGCSIVPGGCGDGQCGPNETCQSCPKDCGTCPTLCGNGICGPNETCQSCPKDCGTCPTPCGNGICGPNETCQSCPKDCGTCPTPCGNGICGPNETCQSCPKDCGTCPTLCGNGICEPNETCQSCPKDCGPCNGPTGCLPLDQAGCSGCPCEQCVCQADPFCCDVQWDGACVDVCAWKCNGCDPDIKPCGDGVCAPGESCENCIKDCGECSPQGAGCTVSDIAGCGGCACEQCVCDTDPFCCEVQWDELCVEECASLCNGCDATFPVCGDGNCSFDESCDICPKDCGECPSGGSGCFPTEKPGCGGCPCEGCVCEMDPFCCDSAWDDICVNECEQPCGGCDDPSNPCGDGLCMPTESCQSCPADCGPCKPSCGNGLCEPEENCTSCAIDCGKCPPGNGGCVATNTPGCGGCPCEECVCKMDSFCCNTAWDGICVNECKSPCGGCGGTPTDICGNKSCGFGESCTNCPQDCGQCPPVCGDNKCNVGESCQNCPKDCGTCPSVCGDKQCNSNESCQTCPSDCGTCPNPTGLSCVDIYNCYMDCETTTCANQCVAKGSAISQKLFNIAYECVVDSGCFQYDTDAEIQNCAIQFCFQQIVQCVTQSQGGIAP